MYIHVDLSQVPPVVDVREAEDFSRFSVVAAVPSHAWVDPDALVQLAGRAEDAAWREKLTGMLRFATSKGWLDEQGRIRAHVHQEQS